METKTLSRVGVIMEELMKLHIGVGKVYIPGFINLDIFSNVRADIYSSALAIPYPPETFDLLYSSHILEHFNRYMVLAALGHWRNLLKVGGILRLAVPDFAAIVYRYMKNDRDLEELMGLLYGGQDSIYNFHHIVFDTKLLTKYLRQVGFVKIRQWDWRKTDHSEYDDYSQCYLPHLQKDTGLHMSLNLEAIKT
jgi:predicted SAM-dependent methyltransferase